MKNNNFEYKGYKANLIENNNKNNLYYTNIMKSRQNLYLKLISAIYNLFDDNLVKNDNNNLKTVISYNFYRNGKLLND